MREFDSVYSYSCYDVEEAMEAVITVFRGCVV